MKKIIYFLLSLFLLGFMQSFGQVVTVGSGSYTTQLPPADGAGRNQNPAGTPRLSGAALNKPVASSDWWTGLLTFDGANLYNYPLSMKGIQNGLIVSFTSLGQGVNDTRQPMGPEQPIIVGVSGLSGIYPTVSNYSDWNVTAAWSSNGHTFEAIMGMGSPFVYCTKGNADVAEVTVNTGTVAIQNEMLLITNGINSTNYAVYAPAGSVWTANGKTYTSTLAGKNYYSIAMLPTGANATTAANDYKQYAYVFPANTAVSWAYNNANSTSTSTFTVTTDVKEGTGSTVILGLLPHQWAHLSAGSAQPGAYTYPTVRGTLKMVASNTFVVENKFKGILPTLPNTAKYSQGFEPGALNAKIDQVKNGQLYTWTDSYNEGLEMNRLIQVAKIADQVGNTAARDQIVNTVRTRLENWFKAEPNEVAFVLMYNKKWSTMIPYPAGYFADSNLNDHHFHFANFINAASVVEQFQPGWAAKWGGMVNLLVKDAANWDKEDGMFPFLRNFNPYAGHSFAAGLLNNEPHGNNQESSSEAMNFNSSLINWGLLTNNNAIRDLGIYLYTTEATAIEEYWFDMNDRNFNANFSQIMCSRVWGNGYDKGTFWTNDIEAMYGIELFPMTGASFYLGHNNAYATKLWKDIKDKTAVIANKPNDNLWFEIYWQFMSLTDPKGALDLYNAYPGYKVKGGCSDAHTYHWLHSMNALGVLDASVTADYPTAVMFNKAGDKTYVAHNYGATEITVTYSDGFSFKVPARSMKTNKDADVTVALTGSATEVLKNGSITLTATTVGAGITKVEFYDGVTLVGTSTSAPYTFDAVNLPAKVHGFYAKAYVGTNIQLSNVISVTVGSQVPYSGTAIAIPSQAIEAGNYDIYEGGLGQGITYFDANTINEAKTNFRDTEQVDAGPTPNEGNTVGWIDDGEWLEYSVDIAQAGAYDLNIRYASGSPTGGPFHIEVDGVVVAGNITTTFTSKEWNVWVDKKVTGIILPAGKHVIRYAFDKGGYNLGKTTFTFKGAASPALAVSGKTLSVLPYDMSVQTFDVMSNIAWTAKSNQDWLVVKSVGFGNEKVTLTAAENTSTVARSANLTVSGTGVADQVLTVTQDAGGVSYVALSTSTVELAIAIGSNQTINIISNVDWTASSDQTWLTLNNLAGNRNGDIILTAEANTALEARTATVSITGTGMAAKTIVVTQIGAPVASNMPIDFETGAGFTNFDGGIASVIANPQMNAGNMSAKLGKIVRNGGQPWAGSYLSLAKPLDFTASSIISMKVFSPRAGVPVLFKLESTTGTPPVEMSVNTTTANTWETLTWNFAGKPSNAFDHLVLIFDFGTLGDGSANSTFLFDDIMFKAPVVGQTQINLPVSFDVANVDYSLSDFGGNSTILVADPTNANNKVAKSTKTTGGATWAGTTMSTPAGFSSVIPFNASLALVSVMVYSPAAGIPVRLKAENHGNNTLTAETETKTTVANAWEKLVFDFTKVVPGTNPFNASTAFDMLSIFFNFNAPAANDVYYWDNVKFEATVVSSLSASAYSVNLLKDAASNKTIDITANVTWTASSDQTWLKLNAASGTNSGQLILTADANTTGVDRTANVTITGTGLTAKTVVVTQNGSVPPPTAGIDFETLGKDWAWTLFSNGDNAATLYSVVPNPDKTGINKSSDCGKYIVNTNGDPWAGIWSDGLGDVTITADNCKVKVMVYKNVISPFALKLEKGGLIIEIKQSNTVVNAWEELTFDFTSQIGKTFSRLVIIPDFPATRTAGSINYFDNISIKGAAVVNTIAKDLADAKTAAALLTPASYVSFKAVTDALALPETNDAEKLAKTNAIKAGIAGLVMVTVTPTTGIDFETLGKDWAWTIFENGTGQATDYAVVPNPDKTGINKSTDCGKFIVNADGKPYAGLWSSNLGDVTLTADNCKIKVMVYKNVISNFGLKFENADATVAFIVEKPNTVVNAWEELTFDFTAHIGKKVSKIVIIPDFPAARTVGSINYFDNISIKGAAIVNTIAKDLADAKAAAALLTPASYVSFKAVTDALALPETNDAEKLAKTNAIKAGIAGLVKLVNADLASAKAAEAILVRANYKDYSPVLTALALPETNDAEKLAKTTAINTAIAALVTVVNANLTTAKAAEALLVRANFKDYSAVIAALALPETNNTEKLAKTTAINLAISLLVPTGIEEFLSTERSIYPNPSTGLFTVKLDKEYQLVVTDMAGRLIVSKKINTDNTGLDLSSFAKGVYILYFKNGTTMYTTRVVVE